jgi:tripartite-type tricarboxylate transporter receptor subunit TctC
MYRILIAVSAAVASLLALCNPSWSQTTYPDHPVRVVIGFGVGGPDTTARLIAAQLSTQMGQRFFVDNKPGSSGVIGAQVVSEAAPDGYTLLVAPASLASLPSLVKKLPFDVLKSFVPVSQIAASEASFLLVTPSLPVKDLKEFMAYAKDPKNNVDYASTGIGTGSHLRMALFASANGLTMEHVPYKSPGEAAVSVMAGETKALFLTTTQALPLIKAGKLRAIAYDYPTRDEFMPDVPTMREGGAAPTDLDSGWHGVFAPANTPEPIVKKLEAEIRKAVAMPEIKEKLTNLGLIPVGSSSEEFQQVMANAVKGMGEAARAAGIEPQ